VTTPTCPVRTQDVDENATIAAMPASRSIPAPLMNVLALPPSARSMVNGARIVPPRCELLRQDTTLRFRLCFRTETDSTRTANRAGKQQARNRMAPRTTASEPTGGWVGSLTLPVLD
jgi:hypothetical protein